MNTAVILTARKEKESELPYPLLPFDENICLIDRTLSLLKEAGITRTILVIGYRAELFNKYRSDNVILIKAPYYEFTGSMASLAMVADFIDDDLF